MTELLNFVEYLEVLIRQDTNFIEWRALHTLL